MCPLHERVSCWAWAGPPPVLVMSQHAVLSSRCVNLTRTQGCAAWGRTVPPHLCILIFQGGGQECSQGLVPPALCLV